MASFVPEVLPTPGMSGGLPPLCPHPVGGEGVGAEGALPSLSAPRSQLTGSTCRPCTRPRGPGPGLRHGLRPGVHSGSGAQSCGPSQPLSAVTHIGFPLLCPPPACSPLGLSVQLS